jgi:hypothetical protein
LDDSGSGNAALHPLTTPFLTVYGKLKACIHSHGMLDVREFFLSDKKIFRGPQQS